MTPIWLQGSVSLHAWASVFPSAKWGDSTCSETGRQRRTSDRGVFQGCGEPWKRGPSSWLPMAPQDPAASPKPLGLLCDGPAGAILTLYQGQRGHHMAAWGPGLG